MASYENERRPRPSYSDPRHHSAGWWILTALVALVAVGAFAWSLSDDASNQQPSQIQSNQPPPASK